MDNLSGISWPEIFFLLITLVLFFVAGLVIYNLMVRIPIGQIRKKAIHIAEKETITEDYIPEPRNPELAGIVRSFNQMVARVNLMRTEMEMRVNERTRLLEEGSRLVQEVLDTTPNLLCLINVENDAYNYVNQEFSDFFGVTSEEMLNLGPIFMRGRVFPPDQEVFTKHNLQLSETQDNDVIQSEFRLINWHGDPKWISFRSLVFQRNELGKAKLILFVGQDITQFKENEERLRFLSVHDQLTSLYNRHYFEEEIIRLERGRQYPIGTIMADLDGLKYINDTYGHAAGDQLLIQAATIFRSCFRAEDVVARIGGDEFSALLPGANADTIARVTERINSRFMNSLSTINGSPICMSLGTAITEKGGSLNESLKAADQSMYSVKQSKKKISGINDATLLYRNMEKQ
jgi:diguanylate cyclase (GGDEF)-like protein/PAS domain S-box-containing protein